MEIFEKIKDFILDTLFPVTCLSCGQEGAWICEKCLKKLPLKKEWVCPLCEKNITPGGRACFACKKRFAIDGLLTAISYRHELVSRAIHAYKYKGIAELSVPLGKLITETFFNSNLPLPDAIVPVPLHRRRLRWRGYNQSKLLAYYVAQNLTPGFAVPVLNNVLTRQKNTSPQMKIKNIARRKANARGAFFVSHPEKVKGKKILLIDDVATTGATLFECAASLKRAGAKEVFGLTIARQTFEKTG